MKKILILGGGGMLGHKMYQVLRAGFDTAVTFRSFTPALASTGLFDPSRVIQGVDVFSMATVESAVERWKPDVVVNCVGVIKQLKEAHDPVQTIQINSLFPHLLARTCAGAGSRLIHISTDCVFSGSRGGYTESDVADAYDLYGRTKYLGEVTAPGMLTIRTSIIGHELFSRLSLVDWFLGNAGGTVRGYAKAIYTGLPTVVLAREAARIIDTFPSLQGLYQVSSSPINKYDLLKLINEAYGSSITIEPYDGFVNDKSLDCSRYIAETGYRMVPWPEMITAMHTDYVQSNYQGMSHV
ncbi:MAG: SDR family oxidoreductase [Bacteroidetes bacterium]|nr:MAG: SDR family oxidoreductase [Bacteroidota bacterium]